MFTGLLSVSYVPGTVLSTLYGTRALPALHILSNSNLILCSFHFINEETESRACTKLVFQVETDVSIPGSSKYSKVPRPPGHYKLQQNRSTLEQALRLGVRSEEKDSPENKESRTTSSVPLSSFVAPSDFLSSRDLICLYC